MGLNINKVIIAGNLTRDVQSRFFANERCVAEFGLAINRKYKSDGATKEETTFVDVECWGKTAEIAGQYLAKGRPVYIEGRLKLDTWEDKKTSEKRSKLKIVADNIQFLGKRADGEAGDDPEPAAAPPAKAVPVASSGDDEPPF